MTEGTESNRSRDTVVGTIRWQSGWSTDEGVGRQVTNKWQPGFVVDGCRFPSSVRLMRPVTRRDEADRASCERETRSRRSRLHITPARNRVVSPQRFPFEVLLALLVSLSVFAPSWTGTAWTLV